jgi:hypothetical protein
MKTPEPRFLICAPAHAASMVAGTTFDRDCARCRARVMVAPSGQAMLARNPETVIICFDCAIRMMAETGGTVEFAATATEIASEVRTVQPNTWRKRN